MIRQTVITMATSIAVRHLQNFVNILQTRLTIYAEEFLGYGECGFLCNRSVPVHVLIFCYIIERKQEYSETVHYLLIDFNKAYISLMKEVLYNILREFFSIKTFRLNNVVE